MATPFGSESWAYSAGLLHDLGKFSPDFQNYIRLKSGFDPEAHLEGVGDKVDHSTAGGLLAVDQIGVSGRILAYLITGHHTGLLDWISPTPGNLSARLGKRELLEQVRKGNVPDAFLSVAPPTQAPRVKSPEDAHIWIRMLFSCLVDADFLDTEAFMDPDKAISRGSLAADLTDLKARLDRYMSELSAGAPDSEVNCVRREVLAACRQGATLPPGLFSLTVPTGGSKTLSSMSFALEHALAHGKRRIVVVIPYTSIIEQTAEVLSAVFGPGMVLEHHSNLDPVRETMEGRLASENWDAPIVVTTNVQFFESLFAAKTSACRKLHNLVDSVVIFDEAQMLPSPFLKPILDSLQTLVRHYGVSAVLCTATQPALQGRIGSQQAAFQGLDGVRELMPDPSALAARLRRVTMRLHHPDLKPVEWAVLAEELTKQDQVLAIVNTRKDCRDLYSHMPPGTVHLSALMCAQHRSEVIADLKARLKGGQPLRVISTQLVEAGVDLDFPMVYRALAGLDSMAQAAGRCNREGRLNEKGRLGEVVLFVPPKPPPAGLLRKGEDAAREMLRVWPDLSTQLDPTAFRRYFELFYTRVNSFDEKNIAGLLVSGVLSGQYQFRSAADAFRLIDDTGQATVVVWFGSHRDKVHRLLDEVRLAGPSRARLRALQRFTVTVPEPMFQKLQRSGDVQEVAGLWVQSVDGLYDDTLGLCADTARFRPDLYTL